MAEFWCKTLKKCNKYMYIYILWAFSNMTVINFGFKARLWAPDLSVSGAGWAFCQPAGENCLIRSHCYNHGVILASKVKLSLSLIHTFVLNPTDCMQKNKRWKNAIKDGGSTTMHSKAKGGKKDGLDLKTFFSFGFREFLENFQ